MHYHWRELRKLEAAARAFGSGNLSTRAQLSKKSNIYDYRNQFNEMARQIEASILHQRDMMHGISHELKTPLARLEFGLALLQSPESPSGSVNGIWRCAKTCANSTNSSPNC